MIALIIMITLPIDWKTPKRWEPRAKRLNDINELIRWRHDERNMTRDGGKSKDKFYLSPLEQW